MYVRDACGGLDDVATSKCEKVMRCQGVAFANSDDVRAMLTAQDRKPELALLSAINFSQARHSCPAEQKSKIIFLFKKISMFEKIQRNDGRSIKRMKGQFRELLNFLFIESNIFFDTFVVPKKL